MAHDKRSKLQFEFDLAKHGIAFCNRDMARHKLTRLYDIVLRMNGAEQRVNLAILNEWAKRYDLAEYSL